MTAMTAMTAQGMIKYQNSPDCIQNLTRESHGMVGVHIILVRLELWPAHASAGKIGTNQPVEDAGR
jgi:hypothetical protein